MTVTAVHKDPRRLTLTVEAEFDASAERVWQLWADPRQLERWWGPPTYPATVTTHDLAPGRRQEPAAGVDRRRSNASVPVPPIELHREQDVGGLGPAIGDRRVVGRALEIGIVEIDVGEAMACR